MDGYYGEPVADVPPSIWWRLYRGEEAVGYRQLVAGTELFSKDGYCWKGGHISHDASAVQTDLRDRRNERVFHLDRITFKRHGSGRLEQAIALQDESLGTLIWFYRSGELFEVAKVAGPGFPRAERRIESMLAQPGWSEKGDEAMRQYRAGKPLGLSHVLFFAATGVIGGAVAFVGSYEIVRGVGPLSVFLGAMIVQALFFARVARIGGIYDRRWLKRLSVACGVVATPVLGAAWMLAHRVLEMPSDAAAMPVIAVACGTAVAIATLLAGDLVAWRNGGYSGELQNSDSDAI